MKSTMKNNEYIGLRIEKEVAVTYPCYSFPCYAHGCFDFETPEYIIEVKSCHELTQSTKVKGKVYYKKGIFYLHKDSHEDLKTKAESVQKTPLYVFVVLNEKHEIIKKMNVAWSTVNEILKESYLLKRGDYKLSSGNVFVCS